MKQHMQYIIDHADEIDKLIKVKAQVSEVKSIMLENIDKVCDTRYEVVFMCLVCSAYIYISHFSDCVFYLSFVFYHPHLFSFSY